MKMDLLRIDAVLAAFYRRQTGEDGHSRALTVSESALSAIMW
jgi:hypothetical protein